MPYRWGRCCVDVMWNDSTLATYNPILKFRHEPPIHPVTATLGIHIFTILTMRLGDCTITVKKITNSHNSITATLETHWRSITILTIMSGDCTVAV